MREVACVRLARPVPAVALPLRRCGGVPSPALVSVFSRRLCGGVGRASGWHG